MKIKRLNLIIGAAAFLAAGPLSAQVIRSFRPAERKPAQKVNIPRNYMPPKGMCRIWIDSVPPRQQPAPTDCATAIRNKPQNGRVIFADDDARSDSTKRTKGKPKKPGS